MIREGDRVNEERRQRDGKRRQRGNLILCGFVVFSDLGKANGLWNSRVALDLISSFFNICIFYLYQIKPKISNKYIYF